MDWNAEFEARRDMLMRIIALLYSLADLAERAALAPVVNRRETLGVLRRGGACAWQLAAGSRYSGSYSIQDEKAETFSSAFVDEGVDAPGDSPADAIRLAMSFRSVALLLAKLGLYEWVSAPDAPSLLVRDAKAGPGAAWRAGAQDLRGAISRNATSDARGRPIVGAIGPPEPRLDGAEKHHDLRKLRLPRRPD